MFIRQSPPPPARRTWSIQPFGAGLALVLALAWLPARAVEITLGDLAPVYDGTAKAPSVATDPAGLPVQLAYREYIFNDSPDELAISYDSLPFQAQHYWGLGNYIQLGGTARQIESCEVTLVTWAKAAKYPDWAAANPAGYTHPLTLTFYSVSPTNALTFLGEKTTNVFIPWRPLTLPDGSPWPANGYAFRARFDFPAGFVLPDKVMAMISCNTQSSGFDPTGVPGPYNELNAALHGRTPTGGHDLDPNVVLRVQEGVWYYPTYGWEGFNGPMLRIKARGSTTVPPTRGGSYEVTATATDPESGATTQAVAVFTVVRATAGVTLGNLVQPYTGTPRQVTVTTNPTGLATITTYNNRPAPLPTQMGTYLVRTRVIDANYQGYAEGTLRVGDAFASWMAAKVAAGIVPAAQAGERDDPDRDGIPNFLEYAFASNPVAASTAPLANDTLTADGFALVYRLYNNAADFSIAFDQSDDLVNWSPVTPTSHTLIQRIGSAYVYRAVLPAPPDPQQRSFYRVRVVR